VESEDLDILVVLVFVHKFHYFILIETDVLVDSLIYRGKGLVGCRINVNGVVAVIGGLQSDGVLSLDCILDDNSTGIGCV
jgi:hypothetical protein